MAECRHALPFFSSGASVNLNTVCFSWLESALLIVYESNSLKAYGNNLLCHYAKWIFWSYKWIDKISILMRSYLFVRVKQTNNIIQ